MGSVKVKWLVSQTLPESAIRVVEWISLSRTKNRGGSCKEDARKDKEPWKDAVGGPFSAVRLRHRKCRGNDSTDQEF